MYVELMELRCFVGCFSFIRLICFCYLLFVLTFCLICCTYYFVSTFDLL